MYKGKTFRLKTGCRIKIQNGSIRIKNALDYINEGEDSFTVIDGDEKHVYVIANTRYANSTPTWGVNGIVMFTSAEMDVFFEEVPHPSDVQAAMEMEDTPQDFNADSLEHLHRADSNKLFKLAEAVKDIEQAGYNGGIAQQIDALKKYQSILNEIKQQIIDNRPMCM